MKCVHRGELLYSCKPCALQHSNHRFYLFDTTRHNIYSKIHSAANNKWPNVSCKLLSSLVFVRLLELVPGVRRQQNRGAQSKGPKKKYVDNLELHQHVMCVIWSIYLPPAPPSPFGSRPSHQIFGYRPQRCVTSSVTPVNADFRFVLFDSGEGLKDVRHIKSPRYPRKRVKKTRKRNSSSAGGFLFVRQMPQRDHMWGNKGQNHTDVYHKHMENSALLSNRSCTYIHTHSKTEAKPKEL